MVLIGFTKKAAAAPSFRLSSDKRTITGINNPVGKFPVIPKTVTSIADRAFYNQTSLYRKLTGSVIIPKSVRTIGLAAFGGCSGLTSLTFESGSALTSIGLGAFAECSGLTGTLVLPNSLTSIGETAFRGCSGLTGTLVLPNSLTSIVESAFYGCSGLTGTLVLPNSLTSIGTSAFEGCSGLTGSLVIPNSVTSIVFQAFKNCTNLFILYPSVITPGPNAFSGVNKKASYTIIT